MSPLMPLLALIARQDAYGYELKRVIETEFAADWRIDFAQLYRALAKLEERGLVQGHRVRGGAGPDRKVYRATHRGHATVDVWLEQTPSSRAEFQIMLRLALMLHRNTRALIRAEREREEQARQQVQMISEKRGEASPQLPLRFAGSDDALLARLVQASNGLSDVTGSTAGLMALAGETADVAGIHLRTPNTDEYNVSFVEHLVPEQDVLLVRLAVREYGLMVLRGNPKRIRTVRDLKRSDVRMLNRAPGAGSRLWLQRYLREAHVVPETVRGWWNVASTYRSIALAIGNESADVGPGLRAIALENDLDFVALGEERFELALARQVYEGPRGETFREVLHSQEFRNYARTRAGYDLAQSGRVVAEIKFGQRRNR